MIELLFLIFQIFTINWLICMIVIILNTFIFYLFIVLFKYFIVNFYFMTLYYIALFLMAHYVVIKINLIVIIHSLWFHLLVLIDIIAFTFIWFRIFVRLAIVALSASSLTFLRHGMISSCVVFWNKSQTILKCAINILLIIWILYF